ncbi:hypothetical protein QMK19_12345 [Streptomyces sp. H10-C2]|uniref:DUF6059 family protein n=1 Tax=unclassified Streptomyces TaxID=2593676 RepID=UPI0024B91221|nr:MULTISPECIES: DUF6059 family protein [unclassified Streptomyces]MDJ0341799.1 hypothetical protein [Streptomyces sp. PH10-H1]MDJ0370447.1 hypothetical protein [Streptomyces sp. H10-C2]
MSQLAKWSVTYFLGPVYRALVTYGTFYVPITPYLYPSGRTAGLGRPKSSPVQQYAGPAAGHPEALRPDVPLSSFEREAARQLGLVHGFERR